MTTVPQAPKKPMLSQELLQLTVLPCRSMCLLPLLDYMKQLQAGEGTMGKGLSDCIFSTGYDEVIAAAILEAEVVPRSLAKAQSCSDWPC